MPKKQTDRINTAAETLKRVWGYDSLRPGQKEAVEAVLLDQDALVVLPTGGGKSICFQLPALVKEGMCLVISPLIALMKDQVMQLKSRGIQAEAIHSDDNSYEIEQKLLNARNGMYQLFYVSPERLATKLFQHFLQDLPLSFLAVDEAHCISEWGHEFRPVYRQIVSHLPDTIQKIAVTATATTKVQADIINVLQMKEAVTVKGNFVRPNLHWWVKESSSTLKEVMQAAKKAEGSGLIFCESRKQTEFYARKLGAKGLQIESYHAGYDSAKRNAIQQRWTEDKTRIVSCTNAFGMGIDKSDCRFVIHGHLPSSIEAYYQEAGRAGRDLQTAYPLLFFNESAYQKQIESIENQYPDKEILEKLYQVLCDMMELSLGETWEEQQFYFSTDKAICQRARIPNSSVYYGMKVLDDLGIISFEIKKDRSYNIRFPNEISEVINDPKSEFIDRMRRLLLINSHSDGRVSAKKLADALQISTNVLDRSLKVLMDENRLAYESFEGEYAIKLIGYRERKAPIDLKRLTLLKDHKLEKLLWMYRYAKTSSCRSTFIASYFGQKADKDCGVCDNCKRRQSTSAQKSIDLDELLQMMPESAEVAISEHVFLMQFEAKRRAEVQLMIFRLIQEGLVQRLQDQKICKG